MADVFISYASADRDRARILAEALATQGWSVWWDRTIPPGRQFDEVIEEELAAAGCVVVLWSKASVASSWVKTEAADARDRRILVPVLIEDVKLPLEFRRMQAADLSQWRSGPPQSDELFHAIAAQLRRRGQSASAAGEPHDTAEDALAESSVEPVAGSTPSQRSTPPAPSRRILSPVVAGVVVAVVLVGAFVAYNRIGGRSGGDRVPAERPERAPDPTPAAPARAAAPAAPLPSDSSRPAAPVRPRPAPIDISGQWRDTNWGHVSQITQDGESFHFTVKGLACRGNFRSAGTGTIHGNRVESTYKSTTPSEGRCTGIVSADGTTIRSTCVDSVCGSFAASAVRQ